MADQSFSSSTNTLFNHQSFFFPKPLERSGTSKTIPLYNTTNKKPRRWPLVLRFCKGAIHGAVFWPVLLHSLFTVLILLLDDYYGSLGIPPSVTPSLSIVVGLMLVFHNSTSFDRFWMGRNLFTECCASVRNLTRSFLVSSLSVKPAQESLIVGDVSPVSSSERTKSDLEFSVPTDAQRADTEQIVKILIAMLYAIKHNLRHQYLSTPDGDPIHAASHPEFEALLPETFQAVEHRGLALPLQLMTMVEAYIRRGVQRGWMHGPQASQLTVQLNTITQAYGRMQAIRTTPIPVAHLIHTKQILALYGAVLPFSLVDGSGWWSVPLIAVVMFTLYGIDAIGAQLEDPFGYDRNDIKLDAIVEDARVECMVLLGMWKAQADKVHGENEEWIFI